MADLVLTPATVLPGDGAQLTNGIAGVALAPGDVVALDGPTQRYVLATSTTLLGAKVKGVCCCTAAPEQPMRLQTGGVLDLGGEVLTIGEVYCLSGLTPGKIGPIADVTSGDFTTILGVATATNLLALKIWQTDVQKA